jgi:hypothetical protein
MKLRIFIVLLISSAIFFINCNSDDDSTQRESLNGTWNLKNVSGGFPGVDVDYKKGSVTWKFIQSSENLIVRSTLINNGPQSVNLPLQSGNYIYTLTESNDKTFIQIEGFGIYENGEYGRYEITPNGVLMIDQGEGSEASADDVFIILFD